MHLLLSDEKQDTKAFPACDTVKKSLVKTHLLQLDVPYVLSQHANLLMWSCYIFSLCDSEVQNSTLPPRPADFNSHFQSSKWEEGGLKKAVSDVI